MLANPVCFLPEVLVMLALYRAMDGDEFPPASAKY